MDYKFLFLEKMRLSEENEYMLLRKPFYFMRHGESEHNAKGIAAGGQTDSALTLKGIQQASSIKKTLLEKPIGNVFASPMQRAHHTAKHASGRDPIIVEALREWNLGNLEGQPFDEFLAFVKSIDPDQEIPQGETLRAFFQRSLKAINAILDEHEQPLIVAHGGTYAAILHAIGEDHYDISNGQCVEFRYEDTWIYEML